LHYWAAGLHSIDPRISERQNSTYFFMNRLFNSGLKSTHFVECYCSSFDTEKCHMTCVSLQFLYDLSLDLSGKKNNKSVVTSEIRRGPRSISGAVSVNITC